MDQFFAGPEYTGKPFELFGTAHLVALLIVLLFNLFFLLLKKDPDSKLNRILRYSMAAILIVNETGWHLWNLHIGQWSVQTMLPLHLCSLFVILSAIMLITKNYRIYEFAYFLGIGGALQPLLTPDAGMYGFPHFRFFQVIISHGLIVSGAIYMTIVAGYRPYWSSYKRVLAGGGIYMLFTGLVNWLIGSNYLFIAHKPETASLLDVLPPWPWYLLFIILIGVVLFFLLYLPFWIKDLRSSKKKEQVSQTI